MRQADSEQRLQRARSIGRIAYRLVRALGTEGFIETDCGPVSITLFEAAHREPSDHGVSQLRIHHAGKLVMEICWDAAGAFTLATFEEGVEWIGSLRGHIESFPLRCRANQ